MKEATKAIQFYRDGNPIMHDAVDQIIVKVYQKKEKGDRSFLLTSCGQGNGTTSIAINLAIGLAASGWKVLLIDCDIRKKMTYKRLNVDAKIGLADYLSDQHTKLQNIIFPTTYDNLFYIPGGREADNPIRLFCSDRMDIFMKQVAEDYQYIIYDTPSINTVPELEILLPKVDNIMLIASIGITAKKQLRNAENQLERYSEKYMGLIVNRVNKREYREFHQDYDYYMPQKQSYKYLQSLRKSMKKRKGKI